MKAMKVISGAVLGYRNNEYSAARAINHRCRGDADLWGYLAAAAIIAGHLACQLRANLPQRFGHRPADIVGIKSKNASMFRYHVQNVSRADAGNGNVR